MSLEKSYISWSLKQISAMIKNNKINFNHIVQRSYVWDQLRQSSYIESMILGYPIPQIYAKKIPGQTDKRGDNIYFILDGKQRLTTVSRYLNNEFALKEIPPVTYYDPATDNTYTENISGKKFSELPEAIRDNLNTVTLSIVYFENLTNKEEKELFRRINSGMPLSTKHKALMNCKDIEGMLDLGDHEVFKEMLTEKSRESKNQVSIVMKIWCMLNQSISKVSFEGKNFNPLLAEIEMTESEKKELVMILDSIYLTHAVLIENKNKKVAKKLYTETHLVSLVPFFKMALEECISENLTADWINSFFNTKAGTSINESYNLACKEGSAKSGSIITRHNALLYSFKEYFKEDSEINIENAESKETITETEASNEAMEEETENNTEVVEETTEQETLETEIDEGTEENKKEVVIEVLNELAIETENNEGNFNLEESEEKNEEDNVSGLSAELVSSEKESIAVTDAYNYEW